MAARAYSWLCSFPYLSLTSLIHSFSLFLLFGVAWGTMLAISNNTRAYTAFGRWTPSSDLVLRALQALKLRDTGPPSFHF